MVQIVILDDRETNRKIFSKLAASIEPGVTVRSFGDPPELLAWLEHNTPDLIVTDFKMPSMDGAEFIRRFRAQPNSGANSGCARSMPALPISSTARSTIKSSSPAPATS